ncbi:unnamed protein product [Peronospora belbahrii]|uniref:Uncharacterized protein n=1 Tax=Peronospora belbahrii TaxID=622444 RepID=A0ABN8D3Y7_9STRA|nr:unnamed protein product [Peronospora belbahrii]
MGTMKTDVRSKAATKTVVLVSDDECDQKSTVPIQSRLATFNSLTSILSDSDSDIKIEEILSPVSSISNSRISKKTSQSTTSPRARNKTDVRRRSITESLPTSKEEIERAYKRRATSSVSSTPPANRSDGLKPLTPSSGIQSSMNASLVFDMVTSLSTSDPGVAIATLRSIVVLGKEYPSDLLYAELIDRIQSHEAVAYADAVAIYAALVFVFDKALACSCAVTFPNKWEPLATALQEVSEYERFGEDRKPKKNESWRRNLLLVQFFIYCFQQDMHTCRSRYEHLEGVGWVHRTRLFSLLQSDNVAASSSAKARAKSRATSTKLRDNKLIFLAIGWGLQLWKLVFDDEDKTTKKDNGEENTEASLFSQQEGEQACLAIVRLIEMLYLCTDQQINALQRIQAGLAELTRLTRIKFSQALQSPALRTQLASTMIGLSNKSRSKETEWYECNALGRVQLAIKPDTTGDVAHTDGYSWSHFDSFINLKPKSSMTKLLQEISRMQHY